MIVNHRHIAAAVCVDEGNLHLTLRGRPVSLPVSRPVSLPILRPVSRPVSRHFQALFKGQ